MAILTEYGSMRSKAMGYSTVAMEGYPGAAQINPASIGLNDMVQGSTYLFDKKGSLFGRNIIGFNLFQPNLDVKIKKWGIAAYMTYLDFGKYVSTDEKGNLLTRSHSYEQAVSLSGSYELSPFFSVGLGMHFLTNKFGTSSITVGNINDPVAHSFAVDFGVLYKKTYNLTKMIIKPSVGWSLTNFGSALHYYSGQSDPLPMTMQGGLGLRVI